MKNVAIAKQARRRLMQQSDDESSSGAESVKRVSGASIAKMRGKLNDYMERLERERRGERVGRQMRETTAQSTGIARELRLAEQANWDLDELEGLVDEPEKMDIDGVHEGDAIKRIISELKSQDEEQQSDCGLESAQSSSTGRDAEHSSDGDQSALPLRRLAPGITNDRWRR